MKHPTESDAPRRSQIFASRPGTEGGADKYQIVDLRTDVVVAAIPHWYEEADAKRSVRRLVKALHTFYFSGGYFPANRLSSNATPSECRSHLLASIGEARS